MRYLFAQNVLSLVFVWVLNTPLETDLFHRFTVNHSYVCVCGVCVCVCVCVCTRTFTVKASSVWISWTTREQINDVVLKTFISYAKSFHRYVRMKHLASLTGHFILFTHYKLAKIRLN